MRFSKGLSFPLILITGFILASVLLSGIFLFRHLSSRYSPSILNAERYLKKGQLEEAITLAQRVDKDSPRLLILKGRIWLAMSLKKHKGENWRQYGLDSGDWLKGDEIENALQCFRDAINKNPLLDEAHYYLGFVYKEKGWYSEAESEFDEAIMINPDNIDARTGLSALLARMDRFMEAQSELRAAYHLAPDNPSVAKNMAFLFRFYIDKPESALVWFNRYLNNVEERDKDINIAKKEFQELLERYPEFTPSEPQSWRNKQPRFIPRKR